MEVGDGSLSQVVEPIDAVLLVAVAGSLGFGAPSGDGGVSSGPNWRDNSSLGKHCQGFTLSLVRGLNYSVDALFVYYFLRGSRFPQEALRVLHRVCPDEA